VILQFLENESTYMFKCDVMNAYDTYICLKYRVSSMFFNLYKLYIFICKDWVGFVNEVLLKVFRYSKHNKSSRGNTVFQTMSISSKRPIAEGGEGALGT